MLTESAVYLQLTGNHERVCLLSGSCEAEVNCRIRMGKRAAMWKHYSNNQGENVIINFLYGVDVRTLRKAERVIINYLKCGGRCSAFCGRCTGQTLL